MDYRKLVFLVSVALAASGCNDSGAKPVERPPPQAARLPSENDARIVIFNLNGHSENVEILSFKKTDGQLSGDGASYKLFFQATVKWPKGKNAGCLNGSFNQAHPACWYAKPGEVLAPGSTSQMNSVVLFEKTERGWRAQDGNTY